MSAAGQIAGYLWNLDRLKEELVGLRADDKVRSQAEIFRLSVIVQRLLALEGDPIWVELEAQGVVKQAVEEGLKQTWKHLEEMEIPKKITSGLGLPTRRNAVEAELEFPKNLELPGPVIRETILSYLTDPIDELNLAEAILSEVQFLSAPLNLIQLKAVFPILMKKKLLGPIDLMNLCGSDPYIQDFIRQYFEKVLWKDSSYNTWNDKCINLEQLDLALDVNPNLVVLPQVLISNVPWLYHQLDEQATWEVLRRCGSKIMHCFIRLSVDMDGSQQELDWVKCYLELLPNLRALCISSALGISGRPTIPKIPEFLPELPFLKNLEIGSGTELRLMREMMLEKYGPQLELLSLHPIGEARPLEGIPASGATLFSVTASEFHSRQGNTMETVVNFLNGIANCPLTVLCIGIDSTEVFPQMQLRDLLTLISNNWGETLERLEIEMERETLETLEIEVERQAQWIRDDVKLSWILNPGFPKLKQLRWINCYPFCRNREFLLSCPALEKLVYVRNGLIEEQQVVKPVIELCQDKERMLRSNVWKLFPKLEEVQFNESGQVPPGWMIDARVTKDMLSVTREECLAYQLSN